MQINEKQATAATYRWLTEHTIPFLIVVGYIRNTLPSAFIQECTWLFDHDVFSSLLPMYVIKSVVFCSRDVGVPVRRLRRYCIGVRKDKVVVVVPFTLTTMQHIFWRRFITTAEIYFQAPRENVLFVMGKFLRNGGCQRLRFKRDGTLGRAAAAGVGDGGI